MSLAGRLKASLWAEVQCLESHTFQGTSNPVGANSLADLLVVLHSDSTQILPTLYTFCDFLSFGICCWN